MSGIVYRRLCRLVLLLPLVFAFILSVRSHPVPAQEIRTLTILQVTDTHAKLIPHWERFSDGKWHDNSGGFAKLYTKVRELRQRTEGQNVLIFQGDNFHGGAELFFSRGRLIAPILNLFRIDAYTPGNWDFADGPAEFRARFVGTAQEPRLASFPVIAAGVHNGPGAPPGARIGERILPPYLIKTVSGVRVGIIGLNDDKALAQAPPFTIGLDLRSSWAELPGLIQGVRENGAELVVVLSESGLAQNIALSRDVPGIDVMMSADTHEALTRAIVVPQTGTIVIESGEGSRVGQLDLTLARSGRGFRVTGHRWTLHEVDETVPEDVQVKAVVDIQRAAFLSGPAFQRQVRVIPGWQPGTGLVLAESIDTVVGRTEVDLARHHVMESTVDKLIANAFRELTGADMAVTNGFRFGIGIPAGEAIRLSDLYHWLPLASHVAMGEMTGNLIMDRFERFVAEVLDPNPFRRGAGWLVRTSGVRFYLDLTGPTGPATRRIMRAEVLNRQGGQWEPLVGDRVYTVATFHTPGDPLDQLFRMVGVRNLRFLTTDLRPVPPLVSHQPPNPAPKVKVAPDNVMFLQEMVRRYIASKGGVVRGADVSEPSWIVVKGEFRSSPAAPNVVQPLSGAGPDWLATKAVGK